MLPHVGRHPSMTGIRLVRTAFSMCPQDAYSLRNQILLSLTCSFVLLIYNYLKKKILFKPMRNEEKICILMNFYAHFGSHVGCHLEFQYVCLIFCRNVHVKQLRMCRTRESVISAKRIPFQTCHTGQKHCPLYDLQHDKAMKPFQWRGRKCHNHGVVTTCLIIKI